nr:hypothetical protein GCM10025730_12320 [Promicromonospora thailandica]
MTPDPAAVPERVGVYGGGRMGAGIAHAFAVAGAAVTVVESGDAAARAARERVAASLARAAGTGATVAGTVEVVTDDAALAGCPWWSRRCPSWSSSSTTCCAARPPWRPLP